MITLITAVPGSGKTLTSIELILVANKEKRAVFHNINGLKADQFPNPDLIYEAPADWRETPHGSLVIYDECQQPHLYPATAQRGQVADERLTAMETHRHSGHDLVFITQAPTFVHHHIRKLVGEHIHLYRAHGVTGAMRYKWSHTCDNPNDRKEQERADSELWRFPKELFGYYQSATIHTHKFKIPKKAYFFLFMILLIMIPSLYGIFNLSIFKAEPDLPPVAIVDERRGEVPNSDSAAPPPTLPYTIYDWSKTESSIAVAGCMANHDRSFCQCYSREGDTLALEHAQCLSVLSKPLPRNIYASRIKE